MTVMLEATLCPDCKLPLRERDNAYHPRAVCISLLLDSNGTMRKNLDTVAVNLLLMEEENQRLREELEKKPKK